MPSIFDVKIKKTLTLEPNSETKIWLKHTEYENLKVSNPDLWWPW